MAELHQAEIAEGRRMSRTHRKDYTGSRAIERSCRSHGSCPWCACKRRAKFMRRVPADADEQTAQGLIWRRRVATMQFLDTSSPLSHPPYNPPSPFPLSQELPC